MLLVLLPTSGGRRQWRLLRGVEGGGVQEHVIEERVMPEGEQDAIAPPDVVCGEEVQ
jgi:hypothetical protein